ncbi:MAG: hypothetical protein HZB17_04615 [Chloroflexi bacterium]|nr:hypothetical protein [Chloroflexota bacterium]
MVFVCALAVLGLRDFLSFARWQCWGCETFTQGVLTQMCLNSAPGNRGCNVLNDRYEKFLRAIMIS